MEEQQYCRQDVRLSQCRKQGGQETYRNAQVALHLETPNINNYDTIMTAFRNGGVDYDVLGSSYYPFWGYNSNNPSNISNVEKMVKNKYGKKFVILETGWPATLKDSDGTSNNIGGAPGHYNVDLRDRLMNFQICTRPF